MFSPLTTVHYLIPLRSLFTSNQAFSQMGFQASCGWPLSVENYFTFHMLCYK